MVAPFFKKNSLEQTKFALTSTGIQYHGKEYPFLDIVETKSYRVIHQTRHIPMGVTSQHDPAISFILVMRNGDQIQVSEKSTWTYSSKQEKVDLLQTAYDTICEKTFAQRAKKYVDQLESSGFFEYGGCKFFPSEGKIIVDGGRTYLVNETEFLLAYGYIEMVPKQENLGKKFFRKAKQELGVGRPSIRTLADLDVFFALLNHYFNLRW